MMAHNTSPDTPRRARRWKPNTALSYLRLSLTMAEGVRVELRVRMWRLGEDESTGMKADLGSGATSQSDLARTQSEKFPLKATSPKWTPIWAARRERRISSWEERERNGPTHSYLIGLSAELLVVMEMVGQHVITVWYKNSNMGALCVGEGRQTGEVLSASCYSMEGQNNELHGRDCGESDPHPAHTRLSDHT